MSWMGMAAEGRMPGMATPKEVAELDEAPLEEADVRCLQFMIPHHKAALQMAEAVLGDRPRGGRATRRLHRRLAAGRSLHDGEHTPLEGRGGSDRGGRHVYRWHGARRLVACGADKAPQGGKQGKATFSKT